jgi:hypothetical protein
MVPVTLVLKEQDMRHQAGSMDYSVTSVDTTVSDDEPNSVVLFNSH